MADHPTQASSFQPSPKQAVALLPTSSCSLEVAICLSPSRAALPPTHVLLHGDHRDRQAPSAPSTKGSCELPQDAGKNPPASCLALVPTSRGSQAGTAPQSPLHLPDLKDVPNAHCQGCPTSFRSLPLSLLLLFFWVLHTVTSLSVLG